VKVKPVIPRQLANRDVEDAVDHYLSEGSEIVALGLVEDLERAYAHIGRHPATGAARYAHELRLPGLWSWVLNRYPHMIFYLEHPDHIDVWRVLHGKCDIPAWLQDEGREEH